MYHILYPSNLHQDSRPTLKTNSPRVTIPVIPAKNNRSTRVKWRDISRGHMKKHKYSINEQVRWECNFCKSAFVAKETLTGKNSKNAKKLRFPVQYVEMLNEQEISTNTSWWSMREMTRDVTRHIEANECCDICEKITLVWKISTTKRSK